MSKPQNPLSNFKNFLYLVWKHLGLPPPTPIQYDIADFLQYGPKRSVIEAFRGVGKSWVTSAFVDWHLLMNPDIRILVVSASKIRSDDFSTFTLRLINEIPVLQHLKPRPDQRNAKVAFDVGPASAAHAPSVKSVGITGQLAGSRADLIIADDVEIPNNSATQMMRDKLSESVKELDAIIKPGGRIVYLGTPQTEMSLYNALPNRGYTVRIWPARYPDQALVDRYGEKLAPIISEALENDPSLVGKPTDPKRFNDMDLQEREASYGRSGFAMQFMLNPHLGDLERFPLKVSDLIVTRTNHEMAPQKVVWAIEPDLVIDTLPNVALDGDKFYRPAWMSKAEDWHEYTGSVMSIDPSGRGQDETGYAVVKMLNGYLWVTKAGGMRGGYDKDTLARLAKIAQQQKVNRVIIEANFGRSFAETKAL